MLKVCEKRCDQCLFSKNRIVSKKRMTEILKDCVKTDSHFSCHKGSIVNEDIVCNGFFTAYSTNSLRIMGRLGAIKFVNPHTVLEEGLKNKNIDPGSNKI